MAMNTPERGMTVLPPGETNALVRPVATAADVVSAHKAVTALIQEALVDGEDYGLIPGTKRPTLLKPGAERLTIAFGAHAEFEIVQQEVDHDRPVKWSKRSWEWGQKRGEKIWSTVVGESLGLYRYVIRCRLIRPDGRVIGEGMGTCCSLESKYVDRPRETENTILKMAKKRAHVDAVLSMAGLSDRFTQDVEETVDAVVPASPATVPAGSAHPPVANAGMGSAGVKSTPTVPGVNKDSTGGHSQSVAKPDTSASMVGHKGDNTADHNPATGEVRPIERSQIVKIYARAKDAGLKTKSEVMAFITKKLGFEPVAADGSASIKVLTHAQGEEVFALLATMAPPLGPPEPPAPTDADAP